MKRRFAYFYFMKGEPEQVQVTIPAHVAYWKERDMEGYEGGPFADRSGGLITFGADTVEEATRVIASDPFALKDVLEDKWIKEWMVQ